MTARQRLEKAFAHAPVLPLTQESRYALISDCHRGAGNSNDNFLKNQHLYFAALEHYYKQGYTCIELGDGDELWENRSMEPILEAHKDAFWLLSRFYRENRLYLLYGNHDIIKKSPKKIRKYFTSYTCPSGKRRLPLFPGVVFHSGLILKDQMGKKDICLTHGHQADFLNSRLWPLSRFLVRYLWGPAERMGVLDPTSAAKNNKRKRRIEKKFTQWARQEDCILITGHTHRPMIGTARAPYCNTGSCVHPRCITCIEIQRRCLTLVKWTMDVRLDQSLYVARQELAAPVCIDSFTPDIFPKPPETDRCR